MKTKLTIENYYKICNLTNPVIDDSTEMIQHFNKNRLIFETNSKYLVLIEKSLNSDLKFKRSLEEFTTIDQLEKAFDDLLCLSVSTISKKINNPLSLAEDDLNLIFNTTKDVCVTPTQILVLTSIDVDTILNLFKDVVIKRETPSCLIVRLFNYVEQEAEKLEGKI